MEVNECAGCLTLLGALLATGCSTLLAGSLMAPREGTKKAHMARSSDAHIREKGRPSKTRAEADWPGERERESEGEREREREQ